MMQKIGLTTIIKDDIVSAQSLSHLVSVFFVNHITLKWVLVATSKLLAPNSLASLLETQTKAMI